MLIYVDRSVRSDGTKKSRLGNTLYDNFGFGIKPVGNDVVSEPAHISTDPVVASDLLIGTWDPRDIVIDVGSLVFSLTDNDIVRRGLGNDFSPSDAPVRHCFRHRL